MAVSSYDPVTGAPRFVDGDAPDVKVDPTEAAKYAAKVGTRLIGTTADRTGYAYAREGLEWYDTDLDTIFVHTGSGWVATVNDTGWIAVTFTNSWATSTPTESVEYRRKNGVVYLKGRTFGGTSASAFTLPSGFRPKHISRFLASSNATVTATLVTVNTDGTVVLVSGSQPDLAVVRFIADA